MIIDIEGAHFNLPETPAPSEIFLFLGSRGWEHGSAWDHYAKGYRDMSWEQAMACEFYEFITLGGR